MIESIIESRRAFRAISPIELSEEEILDVAELVEQLLPSSQAHLMQFDWRFQQRDHRLSQSNRGLRFSHQAAEAVIDYFRDAPASAADDRLGIVHGFQVDQSKRLKERRRYEHGYATEIDC